MTMKRKNIGNRIRGWLPREPPLPTMQVGAKPKKLLTKNHILFIVAGLAIVMVASGAIFFAFAITNSFSLTNQPQEAQDTVNAYVNALNAYNATAAWNLISPSMQATYGTLQNFSDSFVNHLQESGWHAQTIKNVFVYGTLAEFCLFNFQNSAHVNVDLEIIKNNLFAINETFTFELKTYGFSHYQPVDWRIDCKFTGS